MTDPAKPPTPPSAPPPTPPAKPPAAAGASGSADDESDKPAHASDAAPAKAAPSTPTPGSIESTVMSYRVLAALGTVIADTVTGRLKEHACLILQDSEGMAALAAYRAFLSRTQLLVNAFGALEPPKKSAHELAFAPTVLVGAGKAIAWLIANKEIGKVLSGISDAIRPQTVVTHESVTIDDDALAAEIAGTLAKRGRDVCFPRFAPIELRDPTKDLAMITDAFDKIRDAYAAAVKRLGHKTDDTESEAHSHLEELSKIADTLHSEMLGPKASSSLSLVMSGATRARMLGHDGHWLFLKVRHAGATPKTTTRFMSQPQTEYASGAVATYFLFDVNGAVVLSGTETRYRSFREITDG